MPAAGDQSFFVDYAAMTTMTTTMSLIIFPVRGGNGDGGVGGGVRLLLRWRRMGPPPRQVDESGARGGFVHRLL